MYKNISFINLSFNLEFKIFNLKNLKLMVNTILYLILLLLN